VLNSLFLSGKSLNIPYLQTQGMTTLVAPDVDLKKIKKADEAKDWSCANSYIYAVMVGQHCPFDNHTRFIFILLLLQGFSSDATSLGTDVLHESSSRLAVKIKVPAPFCK
jgi:hypothetical protein